MNKEELKKVMIESGWPESIVDEIFVVDSSEPGLRLGWLVLNIIIWDMKYWETGSEDEIVLDGIKYVVGRKRGVRPVFTSPWLFRTQVKSIPTRTWIHYEPTVTLAVDFGVEHNCCIAKFYDKSLVNGSNFGDLLFKIVIPPIYEDVKIIKSVEQKLLMKTGIEENYSKIITPYDCIWRK